MVDEIQIGADTSGAIAAFAKLRRASEDTWKSMGLAPQAATKSINLVEKAIAQAAAAQAMQARGSQQAAAAARDNARAIDLQARALATLAQKERQAYAARGLAQNAGGRIIDATTGRFAPKSEIDAARAQIPSLERIVELERRRSDLERQRALNAQAAARANANSAQMTAAQVERQAQLQRAFSARTVTPAAFFLPGGAANSDITRWQRLANVMRQIPPATWATQLGRGAQSLMEMGNSARYALFSVSMAASVAGVAIGGWAALAVKAAIDHERAFANVERTTQTSARGYEVLRRQLELMSMELPITFEELTNIATAAGQLGINPAGIQNFTNVVAKLSATTNLTSEAAGIALARFKAFFAEASDPSLAVTEATFGNLASSILKVGINSIASETGIVNVSTQISSMGQYAGFTANQVIGLAGALSSVGVAPELARGLTTRLFTIMGDAVSSSGVQMEKFASIAGVTGAEFEDAWGTERFAPVFQGFLEGINKIQKGGGDANQTLRELGITAVRDRPVWLRLANAAGESGEAGTLLAQTLEDARTGWIQNAELAIQYGKISRTTAARIQVMSQAFEQLFATMGKQTANFVGDFAAGMTDIIRGFESFAQSDFGQVLGSMTVQGAALLGSVLLVVGGVALLGATLQGVGSAFTSVSATGVGAMARLGAAVRIVSLSLGAIGIVATLATAVGAFIAMEDASRKAMSPIQDMGSLLAAMREAGESGASGIQFVSDASANVTDEQKAADRAARGMAKALFGVEAAGGAAAGGLGVARDAAKEVLYVFDQTADQMFRSGLMQSNPFQELFRQDWTRGFKAVNLNWDQLIRAAVKGEDLGKILDREVQQELLRATGNATIAELKLDPKGFDAKQLEEFKAIVTAILGDVNGDIVAGMAMQNALVDNTDRTVAEMIDDFELLDEATQKVVSNMAEGLTKFVDTKNLIGLTQQLVSTEEGAAEAFEKAWVDAYGGASFGIESYLSVFRRSADEQRGFIENLQQLSVRGLSDSVIQELMTMGPEANRLVQSLIGATDEQLAEFETLWSDTGMNSMVAFATQAAIGQHYVNEVMALGGLDALKSFNAKLASGEGVDAALQAVQTELGKKPLEPGLEQPDSESFKRVLADRLSGGVGIPVNPYLTKTGVETVPTGGGGTTFFRMFASGGYTGAGGKYDPAGIVHREEFVFDKDSTRAIGVNNLYAMMNAARGGRAAPRGRGFADGGYTGRSSESRMVELSPRDRRLIEKLETIVSIGDEVIGRSVARNNFTSRRGGRG